MRTRLILAGLVAGVVLAGTALATPVIGVVADTARGSLPGDLKVNTKYANGGRVKLQLRGPIEIITQRIEIAPGGTVGWHTHPGENVNVIRQGTAMLYHDEACTVGTAYPTGSAFATHPNEVHLARNEGTETLVIYATYFAPKTTPAQPVRVDAPSPGAGCPQ